MSVGFLGQRRAVRPPGAISPPKEVGRRGRGAVTAEGSLQEVAGRPMYSGVPRTRGTVTCEAS